MQPTDEPFNPYASPQSELVAADGRVASEDVLAAGEVIRVEGVLTPQDLFHANNLAGRPAPSDAVGCVLVMGFTLLPWAVILAMWTGPLGPLSVAMAGLALAIYAAWSAFVQLRRVRRYWRERRGVCSVQRIEISHDEIRHQTEAGAAVYRWSAFSKHSSSPRVVLLHFDPPGSFLYDPPQSFLLVPRSLFAGDGEWNRFVTLVQQKLPKQYYEPR
jgi:hypothetical protein